MAKTSFTPAQKRALLWIIAILAGFRFIGTPVLEHQEAQRTELRMTTQQLERTLRLLNQDEGQSRLSRLQQLRETTEQRFLPYTTGSNFRLSTQSLLQETAGNFDLETDLIDWVGQREAVQDYLFVHQARVTVTGNMAQIMRFLMFLETELTGIQFNDFTLQPDRGTVRQRREGITPDTGRLTLLIDVAGVREGGA